jgi:hypothetical protein
MAIKTALKAGTQTGSLINHIMSGGRDAQPEVGMGATILGWTDRHAATVVGVSKSGKSIQIVQDIATRVDGNGMSDSQEYTYTPGTGTPQTFTLRNNGAWVAKGQGKNGSRVALGYRNEYYDYSF